MDQHTFETVLLRMWTATRIPLTRANVQAYTGAPRDKIEPWLDALCHGGIAEVDSDEAGELLWVVKGSARVTNGPRTVAEAETLERLRREVDTAPLRGSSTLALRADAQPLTVVVTDPKSVAASGVLSFFFGPLGLLYAAPLTEAVPAIGVYMALVMLLPHALLSPILGVLSPLCGLAGAAYAWRYNQTGRRMSLVPRQRPALPPPASTPRR